MPLSMLVSIVVVVVSNSTSLMLVTCAANRDGAQGSFYNWKQRGLEGVYFVLQLVPTVATPALSAWQGVGVG